MKNIKLIKEYLSENNVAAIKELFNTLTPANKLKLWNKLEWELNSDEFQKFKSIVK